MPGKVGVELRPVKSISQRVIPSTETLEQEYASKYLELIGVSISKDNIETLLKELPIEKALVTPMWARGEMAIFPGMGNARKSDIDALVKKMYEPKSSVDSGGSPKANLSKTKSKQTGQQGKMQQLAEGAHEQNEEVLEGGNKAVVDQSSASVFSAVDTSPASKREKATVSKSPPPEAKSTFRASARSPLDAQPQVQKTSTPFGRKISWATVNTLDIGRGGHADVNGQDTHIQNRKIVLPGGEELSLEDIKLAQFRQLLHPPEFTDKDMDGSIFLFCTGLGQYAPRVKDDKTGAMVQKVKSCVSSRKAHSLYGLLCHYAYWNVLHPWARDVLSLVGSEEDFCDHIYTPIGTDNCSLNEFMTEGSIEVEPSDLASETSLENVDKEQLYLQIQETLMLLLGKIGSSKTAIVTSQQSLVCCAHYVVDDLLTMMYPWLNAHFSKLRTRRGATDSTATNTDSETNDSSKVFSQTSESSQSSRKKKKKKVVYSDEARVLSLKIRRLMHQAIADLLDPSRIYTNHMLVSNYVGADAKSLTKAGGKGRFYTTSIAVRSVFGDAADDSTRRFMMKREDTYVPTPGIARKFDERNAIARDAREKAKQAKLAEKTSDGTHVADSPLLKMHKRGKSSPDAHVHNKKKADVNSPAPLNFKELFKGSGLKLSSFVRTAGLHQSPASPAVSPKSSKSSFSPSTGLPRLTTRDDPVTSAIRYGLTDVNSLCDESSATHSLSVDLSTTTRRSVVDNKNADFKVSLKGKASLMQRIVAHRAGAYTDFEKVRKRIIRQDD